MTKLSTSNAIARHDLLQKEHSMVICKRHLLNLCNDITIVDIETTPSVFHTATKLPYFKMKYLYMKFTL
jgi:hypothetical protein